MHFQVMRLVRQNVRGFGSSLSIHPTHLHAQRCGARKFEPAEILDGSHRQNRP